MRKELEKLVIERLPLEFTKAIENQFHNLSHLWKLCVERYENLNFPISPEIKSAFEQTKLVVLNPQAHHNITIPVYRIELEKAFKLVTDLSACPYSESHNFIINRNAVKFLTPNAKLYIHI